MTDYIGNGEKLIIGIICKLLGEKYEAVHDSRNQNHYKAEVLNACKAWSDIIKRTPACKHSVEGDRKHADIAYRCEREERVGIDGKGENSRSVYNAYEYYRR